MSSFKAIFWVDSYDSCSKLTLNHSYWKLIVFTKSQKCFHALPCQLADSLTSFLFFFFCSGNKVHCATDDNKQPHWLGLTFAPWTLSAVTLFLSVESVFSQTRFENNLSLFFVSFLSQHFCYLLINNQGQDMSSNFSQAQRDFWRSDILWTFAASLFTLKSWLVFLCTGRHAPGQRSPGEKKKWYYSVNISAHSRRQILKAVSTASWHRKNFTF